MSDPKGVGEDRVGEAPDPPHNILARCLARGCDAPAQGYCATHRFERFRDEEGWVS